MNRLLFETTAAALALLAVSACSKRDAPRAEPKPEPATTATPAQAPAAAPPSGGPAEVRRLFASRCAVCHGTDGRGNGPGAAALTPKPRDYSDSEWQKSVTDEQIKNTILLGGAAVGKSPAMPPNPDLQSKPEVLEGLVQHVRSFRR